jgi:hypothetical protein
VAINNPIFAATEPPCLNDRAELTTARGPAGETWRKMVVESRRANMLERRARVVGGVRKPTLYLPGAV